MKLTYQKALEAQVALIELSNMILPVKASLSIARLANDIDREVKALHDTRKALLKNYNVKAQQSDENSLSFSIESSENQDEKKAKLLDFKDKFTELLNSETGEIPAYKIVLSDDAKAKAKTLKPLAAFVEIE